MNSTLRSRGLTPRLRRGAAIAAALGIVIVVALLASTASSEGSDAEPTKFFGLWRTRHVLLALALAWSALAAAALAFSPRSCARWIAASLSIGVTFGAAEALALVGVPHFPTRERASAVNELGARAEPHLDVRGETGEDLALAWGLATPKVPFHYRTDRRGFRNHVDRAEAALYCLGDSFLVAGLLPAEELVATRLEQRLQRSAMNLALVGLAPQDEATLLREARVPLEGRLVLHFVFEGNDLRDSARFRTSGPAQAAAAVAPSWRERSLANRFLVWLQEITQPAAQRAAARAEGTIAGQRYLFHWLANSYLGFEGELEPLAACLANLRQEVEAAGGRYAVVLIPQKIRVLGPYCSAPAGTPVARWEEQLSPLPAYLASWSARTGTPFLDLTSALRAATARGEVPWFPADTHWNAIGHAIAAEAIAAWEPVVEWSRTSGSQIR
ncbi:MAG: hypothetical protein JNM84_28515 [Planctomycetes bacterium]|nr:hypothetical protein [Planctomycetota bacterium]